MVQCPCGYEEQARAASQSRQLCSPITVDELSARILPTSLPSRSLTTQRRISIFPRKYSRSTKCTVRRRSSVRTVLKRRSELRRRYTTNSRETTPPARHKLNSAIAQAYYAKKQGLQRRDHRDRSGSVGHGAFDGVRVLRISSAMCTWSRCPMSRSRSAAR